jgi:hypothetical protein
MERRGTQATPAHSCITAILMIHLNKVDIGHRYPLAMCSDSATQNMVNVNLCTFAERNWTRVGNPVGDNQAPDRRWNDSNPSTVGYTTLALASKKQIRLTAQMDQTIPQPDMEREYRLSACCMKLARLFSDPRIEPANLSISAFNRETMPSSPAAAIAGAALGEFQPWLAAL